MGLNYGFNYEVDYNLLKHSNMIATQMIPSYINPKSERTKVPGCSIILANVVFTEPRTGIMQWYTEECN